MPAPCGYRLGYLAKRVASKMHSNQTPRVRLYYVPPRNPASVASYRAKRAKARRYATRAARGRRGYARYFAAGMGAGAAVVFALLLWAAYGASYVGAAVGLR